MMDILFQVVSMVKFFLCVSPLAGIARTIVLLYITGDPRPVEVLLYTLLGSSISLVTSHGHIVTHFEHSLSKALADYWLLVLLSSLAGDAIQESAICHIMW